jgi:UDP-GlcNAc3NAcA epimerase
MRIVSIVGARPQFVKLAALCHAVQRRPAHEGWSHRIIHTGQHYNPELSSVLFDELAIPQPDYNLEVGSGSHAVQTAEMLQRLEPILLAEKPDWVLLYGDTNSTLAGAIVASKLGLRIAHIESGLRSFRHGMPEEINRIVTDHLSDLLFCPTALALENLRKEGLEARTCPTGDIMYDVSIAYRKIAEERGGPLADVWRPKAFALATVHRAENTDDPERLRNIVSALDHISKTICPVLWPMHPRTKKRLEEIGCATGAISVIPPASYLQMLLLEGRARFILTDSGGVQKEAYFLEVPCITLRDETEWEETLQNGCNKLAGCDQEKILKAAASIGDTGPWLAIYGNGNSADAMLTALQR